MSETSSGTVIYAAWQLCGSVTQGAAPNAESRALQSVEAECSADFVAKHQGAKLEGAPPTTLAAFPTPSAALEAVLAVHERVKSEPRLKEFDAFKAALYMAEGTGGVDEPGATRACQVLENLSPGQIAATLPVEDLLRDSLPEGYFFEEIGTFRLGESLRRERLFALTGLGVRRGEQNRLDLDKAHSNLPVLHTQFFGRYNEIATIRYALDGSRLITLTGAAGIGKTRIALQTLHMMLDQISGSVVFVDLTPLKSNQDAAQAILSALGLKRDAARPVVDNLIDGIGQTPATVLLDNCEHLLPSLAKLVEILLAACSELKFLATSREPLHIKGERNIVIPGLEVPDVSEEMTPERLSSYESIRLFTDRADASRAGFRLTEANAADAAEIVRKLDGIPLAIELAASKMSLLTPGQLLQRMAGQFEILESSAVNVEPRHRTLWSALSWSYNALSPAEAAMFPRLGIFEDHFSIEGAEGAFTGDPALEGELPLTLMAHLLEKSLITVRDRPDGSKEFRLYAAVHEFAREKLIEAGERDDAAQRHYKWYYSVVSQAADEIQGPEHDYWLARFDEDYQNFRAALVWCLGHTESSKESCNYAFAISNYWAAKGLAHEGRLFIEESLARFGLDDIPTAVCQHVNAASMAGHEGRVDLGIAHLETAIDLAEKADYRHGLAGALRNYAVMMDMEGRLEECLAATERAAAIWKEAGDTYNYNHIRTNVVDSLTRMGDPERAIVVGEETLAAVRKHGLAAVLPAAQEHLANAYLSAGQTEKAAELLEEAIEPLRGVAADVNIGKLVRPLAKIAMGRRQYGRAAVLMGASEVLCDVEGMVAKSRVWIAEKEEIVRSLRAQLGEDFDECWRYGQELTAEEVAALALGTERGSAADRRRRD